MLNKDLIADIVSKQVMAVLASEELRDKPRLKVSETEIKNRFVDLPDAKKSKPPTQGSDGITMKNEGMKSFDTGKELLVERKEDVVVGNEAEEDGQVIEAEQNEDGQIVEAGVAEDLEKTKKPTNFEMVTKQVVKDGDSVGDPRAEKIVGNKDMTAGEPKTEGHEKNKVADKVESLTKKPTKDVKKQDEPLDKPRKEVIVGDEEIETPMGDAEETYPKQFNIFEKQVVVNKNEEGNLELTVTSSETTQVLPLEDDSFETVLKALEQATTPVTPDVAPEEEEDLLSNAMSNISLSSLREKYAGKIDDYLLLGYAAKKYVLSNLRENIFAPTMKDYAERGKDLDTKIVEAEKKQTVVANQFKETAKKNKELKEKYSLVANMLTEVKTFILNNKDKNKLQKVLATVIATIDGDKEKITVLANKIKSLNSKKESVKKEINKNKMPVVSNKKKNNLVVSKRNDSSGTINGNRDDGFEDMINDLVKTAFDI